MLSGFQLLATIQNNLLELHAYHSKNIHMQIEVTAYQYYLLRTYWRNFFLFQDVEHLKPHIVRSLANAEFYCMALSVLYADPNFHNLNHWGIIQALARKGICVAEPSDCSLTETVLIQTTPLKMVSLFAIIFWPHNLTPLWVQFILLILKCRDKVCNCVR